MLLEKFVTTGIPIITTIAGVVWMISKIENKIDISDAKTGVKFDSVNDSIQDLKVGLHEIKTNDLVHLNDKVDKINDKLSAHLEQSNH